MHYYFKSKDRLFTKVFEKVVDQLVSGLVADASDSQSSFLQILDRFIDHYSSFILANPDIPRFVIMEINKDPKKFVERMGIRSRFPSFKNVLQK